MLGVGVWFATNAANACQGSTNCIHGSFFLNLQVPLHFNRLIHYQK